MIQEKTRELRHALEDIDGFAARCIQMGNLSHGALVQIAASIDTARACLKNVSAVLYKEVARLEKGLRP